MADRDTGALETWLQEIEKEIEIKQLLAKELRGRLGIDQPDTEGSGGTTDLFSRDSGVTQEVSRPVGKIRPDEFFRLSMPEAIQKYLGIMKSPQPPKSIAEALKAGGLLSNSANFYAHVTTSLKRLRAADKAVLTPSGWGLAEWYPGKAKGKDDGKKKPKKRLKKGSRSRRPASSAGSSEPQGTKDVSDYRQFVVEAMRSGSNMVEANRLWRERQATAQES